MTFHENVRVLAGDGGFRALTEVSGEVILDTSSAHQAMQVAVDHVHSTGGGQIMVGRGRYPLAAPINLRDSVLIAGSGRSTRLEVTPENAMGVALFGENVKGVGIADLAVTAGDNKNAHTGILLDHAVTSVIRDTFVVGFAQYGIHIRNNSALSKVHDCTLAGNGTAGICLDSMARGAYGDFIPNLVSDCVIFGGGKGIACLRTVVQNIVGCIVYQSREAGFYVGQRSNSILISGCRTFQVGSHAVMLEDSHELNVSSNIFCWSLGHGIFLRNSSWGTIAANNIIDVASYNPGGPDLTAKFSDIPQTLPTFNGIELQNVKGYTVTGNAVFNWGVAPRMQVGIQEDAASGSNTITGNNINYYDEAAVISRGTDSVETNNYGNRDKPYDMSETAGTVIQSFRPELIDSLIAELC